MKEKYGIYLDGKKKAVTEENEYVIDGLAPGTEYEVGVSRIVGEKESDVMTVTTATQPSEPELPPLPFDFHVDETGDRYITVGWDSDIKLGDGRYNLYLDGVKHVNYIQGRSYTFRGLEPSTRYMICLCGVNEAGEETQKTTVHATTTVDEGYEEPAPLEKPLVDWLEGDGSFEEFDASGRPVNWENSLGDGDGALFPDESWRIHGRQSLLMQAKDGEEVVGVQRYVNPQVEQEEGNAYWLTAAEFKMDEPHILPNGEEAQQVMIGGHASYAEMTGGSGLLYCVSRTPSNTSPWMATIFAINGRKDGQSKVNVDAVRVYRINEEWASYINGGKVTEERMRALFPYPPRAEESPGEPTGEEEDVDVSVDEVDYDALTIPEIKGILDDKGIEYKSSARKSELIELLER